MEALADGGEAVAAGGGEVFQEVEGGERVGVGGGDLGGRGSVEEIGEENHESAHERGIGVGVKMEATFAELGGEPDGGDAAEDAVLVGAGGGRERRLAAGAVDDEGEAFLEIGDRLEIGGEGGEFVGEGHGDFHSQGNGRAVPRVILRRGRRKVEKDAEGAEKPAKLADLLLVNTR